MADDPGTDRQRPQNRCLEATRGWLDLGAPEEAACELDSLDRTHRLDFDALLLRARVWRHLKDWTRLLNVAAPAHRHASRPR